jgi:hypothetical protein
MTTSLKMRPESACPMANGIVGLQAVSSGGDGHAIFVVWPMLQTNCGIKPVRAEQRQQLAAVLDVDMVARTPLAWSIRIRGRVEAECRGRAAPLLPFVLDWRSMYPQYPRHWLSPSEALNLKEFFYLASYEIAVRLDHNPHADERGLTDELVRVLTNKKSTLVSLLRDRLGKSKSIIDLILHETTIRDEARIGADFGIVLRIATDDVQYQRSALFQAKRLQPDGETFGPFCSYGLEDSRSRRQSEKMVKYNSASFFVLYNPSLLPVLSNAEKSDELDAVTERLTGYWEKHHEYAKTRVGDPMPRLFVPNQLPGIFALPFDPTDAISVVPAAFISQVRPSSLRAQPLHKYTVSFTNFMVDDFIQGKVGDSSEAGIDVAKGKNRNFAVRYSLGLELRSGRFITGEGLMPLFQ